MVGGSNAGDTESGSSTAFVTFRRVADRVAAEQLLLEASPWSWHATAAPEARDVIWANAAFPLAKVRVQSLAISALLTLCLLFWSIPVASLQLYVANLTPKLLRGLLRLPVLGGQLYAFLASYVPVLALMGLMYLLPFFFDFLARHVECHKSNSTIQRRVLDTYFKYQLATLYVTVLSGSLLSSLCEVLESPATVFTILQTKVSLVACYFVNFVMARAGLSTPMLLLFPLLSLGEEDDSGEKVPVRPNYAMEASNLGMVLVLGMTYAMMAPFILPACTVFFAMSSLVYRWLFLYVYTPEFDCNGGIWYELFNGSMVGLEICTLSLAAFAALNVSASSVEFWASLLLWGAVVAVHVLLHNYYSIPSRYISLRDARDMDVACADHLHSLLREDYYIDPVIKSPPEHMFKALQLLGGRTASSCCGAPCGGRSSSDEEEEDDDEEGEPAVAHHRQTSVIVEESSGSDTASEASHRP